MEHISEAMKRNGIDKPTPNLEHTILETIGRCPDCKGMGYFRRDVDVHHPDFGKIIKCTNAYHADDERRRLEQISGMSGSDLDIALSDIVETPQNREMLNACRTMMAKPRGWIYIHGGPGNAKTIALMAMVNHMNATGIPAMYCNFSSLIDWMRDSFREQTALDANPFANLGYIERFTRIKQIKALAIDEFDKARSTPFADDFRFSFLDERYKTGVKGETITLFASNSAPERLPSAIYDRIRSGKFQIVENKQESGRPFEGWE